MYCTKMIVSINIFLLDNHNVVRHQKGQSVHIWLEVRLYVQFNIKISYPSTNT